MALQNRVSPWGEIVAEPWRGSLMGNRGRLHDAEGRIGRARWRTKAWIACRLEFRGRRRAPMPPGRYTALFFWDEATALAAGHRPCGECRRTDLAAFVEAWATAGLAGRRAGEIDSILHAARLTPERLPRRVGADPDTLPAGSVVAVGETALLLADGRAWAWSGQGYAPAPWPSGPVRQLTPAPIVAALGAGYRPALRLPG